MQEGSRAVPLRIENLAEVLEQPLEHEAQILDVLVMAQARGNAHPELWDKLHAAAMRDDRLVELASAYEKLGQDRRVRIMAAPQQAQIFLNASRFLLIGLGDIDGTVSALERVLTLVPGHAEAFEQLARLFGDQGDKDKLCQLHLSVVGPKTEPEVALTHLRTALELVPEGDDERALKIAQQILRIDHTDEGALLALENRLAAAGKYAELARALEVAVTADPPPPPELALSIRKRIVEIYDAELPDIERAIAHVEEVLAADVHDPTARRLAERLVSHKAMGARAAHALERVYEAEGDHAAVAQMLGVQIEQLRGPKRAEVQRRLGLLVEGLGDTPAAYAHYEAVLGVDPGDDEVRARYARIARELGKQADAAKLLQRSMAAVKDPASRARVQLELGRLLVELGDPKRARTLLSGVMEQGADDETTLEAARTLQGLLAETGEARALAQTLEAISRVAPEVSERIDALRKLSELYQGELADVEAAIDARTRIVRLDPEEDPSALESLLLEAGKHRVLAETLEARATTLGDAPEARELLTRAAQVRLEAADDAGATATLLRIVAEHGPSRGVHAMLLPLLEVPGREAQLVEVLTSELELTPDAERPALLARLGAALLAVGRERDALAAFTEVLQAEPRELTSRAALEAMLGAGELRLEASEVLVPLYRADGMLPELISALETRADLHPEPQERLDALAEALEHTSALGRDRVKALFLAARGLREAVSHDLERVIEWTERVLEQSERGPSRAAIAETLSTALRGAPESVEGGASPALVHLARRTAEAHAAAGDPSKALDAYRRVLAFDPDDADALEQVDALLAERGATAERIELKRSTLARPGTGTDAKRELYLAIGSLEEGSAPGLEAAIATYRAALSELPGDVRLEDALLDALGAAERHDELYALLESRRARASELDADGRASLEARLATVALSGGRDEEARTHFTAALDAGGRVDPRALELGERLATRLDDVDLLISIAERRVELAEGDAPAEVEARVRLGALLAERRGDRAAAAACLRRAAQLAAAGERHAKAAELYERVLQLEPGDREVLGELAAVHRASGSIEALLAVTEQLLVGAPSSAEAIALVSELYELAYGEHALAVVGLAEQVRERFGPSVELSVATAKALAAAGRKPEAARALLRLLDELGAEALVAIDALDELLGERDDDASLDAERRALHAHCVELSSSDEERRAALLASAGFEEQVGQLDAAAAIYDRLLELDPSDAEVREGRLEVALATGDHEAVARCLTIAVERAGDAAERTAASLDLAEALLRKLDRAEGALDVLEGVALDALAEPRLRELSLEALGRPAVAARAAALVARVAEGEPDAARRAALYAAAFDSASHTELGPEQAALFDAWIACYDGDAAAMLPVVVRAATSFPDDEARWERAEELARELDQPAPVAEAYRSVLQRGAELDAEVAMRLGERGVAFQEEWFDDEEAVTRMLRLVVDAVPTATWAFERLKLVYNAEERWAELFELYDRVIDAASDDEERAMLLEDAAEVARELAADADRAIGFLERLRAIRPRDARLEATLERLYEKQERHERLATLLEARIERVDDEEARGLRLRVAALYADALSQLGQAVRVVEPLLASSDAEACALADRWLEASTPGFDVAEPCERLARPPSEPSAEARVRLELAELRKKAYEAAGDHQGVARCIEISLEAELAPAERRHKLEELELVLEAEVNDPVRAYDARLATIVSEPGESALVDAAEAAAKGYESRARKLVGVLVALGDRERDADLAVSLLRRASTLARGALGDDTLAIGIDLRLLSMGDQDPEVARKAARELAQTLLTTGRDAERCQVLERLADLEEQPKAKREALVEAARIAEESLKDPAKAAKLLSAWLQLDPSDRSALDARVRNLRALAEPAALADGLEARAKSAATPKDARADHLEIARLRAQAGDAALAIAAYRRYIELYGPTDEVVDELAAQLAASSATSELVTLIEGEAHRITDRSRRAQLYTRLGDVHQSRGDATAEAVDAYVRALAVVPTRESAQDGLEAALSSVEIASEAERALVARGVAALASAYRVGERNDRLLALVPRRLEVAADGAAKADVLLEAARLEEQRRDPAAALAHTLAAFELSPTHPLSSEDAPTGAALGEASGLSARLLERARKARAWPEVAPKLLPALTNADIDARVARDLLVEAATALIDAEEELELAEALLVAAIERVAGDVEALQKLVSVRRRLPRRPLVDALVSLSRAQGGDVEALREAATVALRMLDDVELALATGGELLALVKDRYEGGARGEELDDAAVWVVDVLTTLRRDREERDAVLALLLGAADLPVDRVYTSRYLSEAAELAAPEQAAGIYERLLDAEPSDVEVADKLDALYVELGRAAERARLLERRIGVATSEEERAGHRRVLADVFEGLGRVDDAALSLRATLAELPDDARTVGRLSRLLEAHGRHAELTQLCEEQGARAAERDASAAATYFRQAARLADERLGDPARAARAERRGVELEPSAEALDRLAALLCRLGKAADEAEVLERLAEMTAVDEPLALRLASAHGRAGRVERARECLEQALAAGASGPRVRDVLASLYRSAGEYQPLAELLESEAAEAEAPEQAVSKLREAAGLWTKELARPERAATLFERAIELAPAELELKLMLAESLHAAGRTDDARVVLEGVIADFGSRKPKERALAHLALAKLQLAKGDRTQALAELDTASKIDPTHVGVLTLSGEVSLEEGQLLRAQRTYRGLLLVLKSQQRTHAKELEATGVEEPRDSSHVARAQVLVELAHVAALQKDPDRQAEFIASAFEAAEQDPWEAERLVAALERRGMSELLARALEQRLGSAELDDDRRTELELRLARAKAGAPAEAGAAFELATAALGRKPFDASVRKLAREIAVTVGKLGDYAQRLAELAEGSSEPEVGALHAEVAELARELRDDALLLTALRGRVRALGDHGAAEPEILAALGALEQELARQGDEAGRVEVLREILERSGDDLEAALPVLHALIGLLGARGELEPTAELLERAMRDDTDPERVERTLRHEAQRFEGTRIVRLLEDFARDRERTRTVVDALTMLAERGDDPLARLHDAYEVAEPLGDAALSVGILEMLIAASGEDSGDTAWALSALAERCAAAGDERSAVELWERAARVSPPDEERSILLDVARRARTSLGDAARAVRIYQALRASDPADREAWAPLAELHREAGDIGALSALLDETLPLVDDLTERAALRLQLARMLLERQPERARELLAEAFEEAPGDHDTGDLLASLYEKAGLRDELVILYERQLDAAKDAEDKARIVAITSKLGALLESMGETDRALDVYHGALDWESEHRDSLRAVVRLSMAREDSLDIGDLLDRLLAVEEGEPAAELALKMADLREAAGDPHGAERALFAGYQANPRNKVLRDRLKALYTERGSKADLARLAAVEARVEPDPERRKQRLIEAGESLRDEAGDMAASADAFAAALELDPLDRDVLFAFMDAAANSGQHGRAIAAVDAALAMDGSDDGWLHFSRAVLREAVGLSDEALDDLLVAHERSGRAYGAELRAHLDAALLRVVQDPSASRRSEAELSCMLAELDAEQGQVDAARALLHQILARDPRNRAALVSLAKVEEMAGRYEAAASALERAVSFEQGDALVEIALRLGELARSGGKPELAIGALERASHDAPSDARLREALRLVYEAAGSVDELADMAIADAEAAVDDAQRFVLLLQAARTLLYGTGETTMGPEYAERAIEIVGRARALAPEHIDGVLLNADALGAAGRGGEARELVTQIVAAQRGRRSPELGQAYYALYRVEAREGNLTDALDVLVKSFEVQPQNVAVALELGQLASDLAQSDVAQRAFRSITLVKPGDGNVTNTQRAVAYCQLGRIAMEQGDARRAKLMLERALGEDPTLEAASELLAQLG